MGNLIQTFPQNDNSDCMKKGVDYITTGQKEGTSIGTYATAEGHLTTVTGNYAHGEGGGCKALANYTHSEGMNSTASGTGAHAENGYSKASGDWSHVEGSFNLASSENQHVQGVYNIEDTNNVYAHIVGNGDYNARSNAHTLDWSGNAWFAGDVTDGSGNVLSDKADNEPEFTEASTRSNIASGESIPTILGKVKKFFTDLKAVAFSGSYSDLSGTPSSLPASDVYSWAKAATKPSYTASEVGALASDGTAVRATADADGNTISSTYMKKGVDYVTAGKKSGTTLGTQATAEGSGTTASKSNAHAEGYITIASGEQAHAEGSNTMASGDNSHSEGDSTMASGNAAHTEGSLTVASGRHAHAEGMWTKASSPNQHVEGKYNVEDSNSTYAHIIGGGTADDARKNIFTVDWNGDVCAGRSNGLTNDTKLPTGADVTNYVNTRISGTIFYSGNSGNAEHDANNMIKNGNYYYTSNGPGTGIGASTNDGSMYVQAYSDSWVSQIAQDYRNGQLFVRGKNNGTWQSWFKVYNSNNLSELKGLLHPVGTIIESTTCDTMAKVVAAYGGTTWKQHSGYVLYGATTGVSANNAVKNGGDVNHTPGGTVSKPSFTGTAASLGHSGGGVQNFTLTAAHIPAHTHGESKQSGTMYFRRYGTSAAGGDILMSGSGTAAKAGETWSGTHDHVNAGGKAYTNPTRDKLTITTTHTHTSIGSGGAHNHGFTQPNAHSYTPAGSVSQPSFTGTSQNTMPPYKNVYIWERTA